MGYFKGRLILPALMAVMTLFFSVGCASTTTIDSDPQGAEVTINGQYIGTTPVQFTDSSTIAASHRVVLEKPGYETTRATLKRDGDLNVGVLVLGVVGIFVCLPVAVTLLWVVDYPDHVEYQLRHGKAEEAPDVIIDDDGDRITFQMVPRQDTELAVNSCGGWE